MIGMVNHANPAVSRVQLGITMRLLREQAAVKPRTVAETMVWHGAKLTRLEQGQVTISDAEIDRLADLYAVTDEPERERLRKLAAEARRRGRPPRVPDWGQTYVALESAAAEIKVFTGELFPGLLQTEDYARALLSHSARTLLSQTSLISDDAEVDDRAAERAQRGKILTNDPAPDLWVVVSEGALHRMVGGREVFLDQLRHVVKLSKLPNVTLQVLPFGSGEHVAIDTSFTLLHLADPVATYVYLEGLTDADYLDKPNHTAVYVRAFDRLRVSALSDRESATMLTRRIADLSHG